MGLLRLVNIQHTHHPSNGQYSFFPLCQLSPKGTGRPNYGLSNTDLQAGSWLPLPRESTAEPECAECASLRDSRDQPLLRTGSGSGEPGGGAIGAWELFFCSPLDVPAVEATAWESGFSARKVSFTVVFAVFKRLINWQGGWCEGETKFRDKLVDVYNEVTVIVGI